jgi:hypothetical protein
MSDSEARVRAIRTRAFTIWEHEGRPAGKDLDHWLRAEAELASLADGAITADVIVMEGPGYVIGRTNSPGTAVPYGPAERPDSQRNYGFLDLRDHPEWAAAIPEARDSIGMQAILQAVNARGFRFMSLGCARGLFPRLEAKPGEPAFFCGSYIQVAYRESSLNTDPKRFVALAQRILHEITPTAEHDISFEMIVEPLRSFFDEEGCYALMMKPGGRGVSEAAAIAAWEYAAAAIAAVFTRLQSEPSPLSTASTAR